MFQIEPSKENTRFENVSLKSITAGSLKLTALSSSLVLRMINWRSYLTMEICFLRTSQKASDIRQWSWNNEAPSQFQRLYEIHQSFVFCCLYNIRWFIVRRKVVRIPCKMTFKIWKIINRLNYSCLMHIRNLEELPMIFVCNWLLGLFYLLPRIKKLS